MKTSKMKKIVFPLFLLMTILATAQVDRSQEPKVGPVPEINLGTPKTFQLDNGLKVLVVENKKLPRVSFTLTIDNPPYLEGEKNGVSSLVGSLLGKGSANIDKDAFNEEVDYMGASISFSSNGAFAAGLSKYTDRILELMADAALHPNFTEEELEKERNILLDNLKSNEKSVTSAARRVESALAYGTNHPYGEYLTKETVNAITMADVQSNYRNYFVPKNAYLVVIGDVDFDSIQAKVTELFRSWQMASPPVASLAKPNNAQYTQINFVDMPNAVQSEIAVQNLVDLQMNDEDYFPALLANKILGGSFRSYLNGSLREDKGYTYGARSRIGADKYASRFRASSSVRNMVTDSSIVVFLEQLDRIRNEKVVPEEIEIAKAEYVGEFVMALERPETVARYALNILTEDLPEDFYSTYLEKINAVTAEEIQAAANKFIDVDHMRIVVTGKGSDVIGPLENIEYGGKTIPVLYYDKYANKTEKPDYSSSIPNGVDANTILQKYIEAIGGAAKVNAVQSLKLVYEAEAMGSKIKIEEKRTSENFAQTTYMNDNPMMGVVAKGDELFMKQGGNKMPLPPDMVQDMKSVMGIFPEQGILAHGTGKLAGIEQVEGKDAYKIDVNGKVVQASFYYDVETGLKVKETSVINMGGQTQNQETLIKDYKEVDGILFPAAKSSTFGPQILESMLLEALVNSEFTEADFE